VVLYDPVARTQILRRALGFEAGDMKASTDFGSVILTDTTTPGLVEFQPGASPEIRRLVDLTNFTYPINVVTAP
jgi:hypothetical protein